MNLCGRSWQGQSVLPSAAQRIWVLTSTQSCTTMYVLLMKDGQSADGADACVGMVVFPLRARQPLRRWASCWPIFVHRIMLYISAKVQEE
jgi:hypothetical protein